MQCDNFVTYLVLVGEETQQYLASKLDFVILILEVVSYHYYTV